MRAFPGLLPFTSGFRFKALPEKHCKDYPQYCIPFPGIEYNDLAGICMFKIPLGAAGAAAAAAAGAAVDGMSSAVAVVDFGTMVGNMYLSTMGGGLVDGVAARPWRWWISGRW